MRRSLSALLGLVAAGGLVALAGPATASVTATQATTVTVAPGDISPAWFGAEHVTVNSPTITAAATNTAEPAAIALACTSIGQGPGTVARFTLYYWPDYVTPCITFYGHGSCTSGYGDNEGLYDLRTYGWSDQTMSVHTYNSCDVRFYDSYNCPSQGTQTGWINNSPDLGAWNNRPSCVLVS